MSDNLTDTQENILRYVPDIILNDYLRPDSKRFSPPEVFPCRALVLLTNILQFAQLTQALLKKYHDGIEIISDVHRTFMSLLQEYLGKTGADIIKHSTDRILVYWPVSSSNTEESIFTMSKYIIHQILALREALVTKFEKEGVRLKVTFTLTLGDFSLYFLGGYANNVEYISAGSGVLQAIEHYEHEDTEFALAISAPLYEKLHEDFQLDQVIYPEGQAPVLTKFYHVLGVIRPPDLIPSIDPSFFKKEVKFSQFTSIQSRLFELLPTALLNYLQTNIEPWSEEIRKIASVCLLIPVNLAALNSENEIVKLNQAIFKVQMAANGLNGFIYRAYLDEKGLNIFVLFGTYPLTHQEDASRASLFAATLVQDVRKLGYTALAGVAFGHARFTVSGEYRKDLFVIGEPIYLSYLLMLASLQDGEKVVLVDHETKIEAEGKVSFLQYRNPAFQNKIANGIFEPIFSKYPLKPLNYIPFPEIRTHHFNLDYQQSNSENDYQESIYMVGRDSELRQRVDNILKFLRTPVRGNLLMIGGSYGVGKTLFLRNLLDRVQGIMQTKFDQDSRAEIITSSLTPYSRMLRLNGWRNAMCQLLNAMSVSSGTRREDIVANIIRNNRGPEDGIVTVGEILDLHLDYGSKVSAADALVIGKEADPKPEEEDLIIDIMTWLIREYVGETMDRSNGPRFGKERPPLIVCLDDAQNHDQLSWGLTSNVLRSIRKVFIINVIRGEELETTNDKLNLVDQGIRDLATNPDIIQDKLILSPLEYGDIERLIKKILEGRQPSVELTKFVLEKSEGMPLAAMDLLNNLLVQGMLQYLNNEVFPNDLLKKYIRLGQFIEVLVPTARAKANGYKLDQLDFNHYNLLKIASTIGTAFDLRTLVIINPLYHAILPPKAILPYLNDLKQLEIIELIDDKTKNLVFKFSNAFMRETIYQRLPFVLRRGLHRMIAECWQNSEDPLENEYLLYQWNLSDPDSDMARSYTNSAKRVNIVRNINNLMNLGNAQNRSTEVVLKTGRIEKLSFKDRTKWQQRFLIITPTALKYYKNEVDFRDRPVFEAVAIQLRHIQTVTPIFQSKIYKPNERPGFKLIAYRWSKGPNEMAPREFYFSCENDEIENWIIHIEYIRAKGIYDEFIDTYDPMRSFPHVSPRIDTLRAVETLGRQSPPIKDERVRTTGYTVNQDFSVGEKLGYEFERKPALSKDDFRVSSPLPTSTRGGVMVNSPKKSKRHLVELFLNKGKILFFSHIFGAPTDISPQKKFGYENEFTRQNPHMLQLQGEMLKSSPNRGRRVQTLSPLSKSIEKNIARKLRSYDQPTELSPPRYETQRTLRSPEVRSQRYPPSTTVSPPALAGIPTYNRDQDEMVETIIKPRKGKGVGNKYDGKDKVQGKISPMKRGKKTLNRPNIYGRYEFFPTFFIDCHLDDRGIRSINNEINNVQDKQHMIAPKSLRNLPKAIAYVDYRNGEYTYTDHEESYQRQRHDDGTIPQPVWKSKFEPEAPFYKGMSKFMTDYLRDYSPNRKVEPEDPTKHAQLGPNQLAALGSSLFPRTSANATHPSLAQPSSTQPSSALPNFLTPNRVTALGKTFVPSQNGDKSPVRQPPNINALISNLLPHSLNSTMPNFSERPTISTPGIVPHQLSTQPSTDKSPIQNQRYTLDKFPGLGNYLLPHTLSTKPSQADDYKNLGLGPDNFKSQLGNLISGYKPTSIQDHILKPQSIPDEKTKQAGLPNVQRGGTSPSPFHSMFSPSQNLILTQDEPFKPMYTEDEPVTHTPSNYNYPQYTPTTDSDISKPYHQTYQPYSPYQQSQPGSSIKPVGPALYTPQVNTAYINPPQDDITSPHYTKPFDVDPKKPFMKSPLQGPTMSNTNYPETHNTAGFPQRDNVNVVAPNKDHDAGNCTTIRPTRSQDGDDFNIDKGEFVVITRNYEKRGLVELLWNGLSGLFPASDVEVIRKTDMDDFDKHITVKPSSTPAYSSDSESRYKMIYSERSEKPESIPSIKPSGDYRASYADDYNNYSASDHSDGDYRDDESIRSNGSKGSAGKLPTKLAKRQQARQQKGIIYQQYNQLLIFVL